MKQAIKISFTVVISLLISSCAKRVKVGNSTENINLQPPSSYDFVIPKAFSPNGDGNTDVACFTTNSHQNSVPDETLSIAVFNRWGVKIWETNNAGECWDGNNINDNKPLPSGVYFVKIEHKGKESKTGSLTLIR